MIRHSPRLDTGWFQISCPLTFAVVYFSSGNSSSDKPAFHEAKNANEAEVVIRNVVEILSKSSADDVLSEIDVAKVLEAEQFELTKVL